MHKFLLFVCLVASQDTLRHTHYNDGGLIPDKLSFKDDSIILPKNTFIEPIREKPLVDPLTKPVEQNNSESYLQKFAKSPASDAAKNTSHYSDWDSSNAERFVNSPCYKSMGFDAKGDLAEQEKRYTECEGEHHNQEIIHFAIYGFVLLGISLLFFLAVKKSPV